MLAFSDKDHALHVIDVASGKVSDVDKDDYGDITDYRWSPDSRWLTYTKNNEAQFSSVYVYNLADTKVYRLTSGMTNDANPVFDPKGRYLYFTSNRDFNLTFSAWEFNYVYTDPTRVYVGVLAEDGPALFLPQSDEEKAAAADSADAAPKADAKPEAKADSAKPADTADLPDEGAIHDALKAQHANEAHDGKPADAAGTKPANGDEKAATEQKTHHAAGAEKAADKVADALAPNNTHTQTAQTQAPQTQPQAQQVQHAAQSANAAAAPQAPAVPVEGVGVQIAAQAKAGKHSFEIRLDPPELGRIDVRLDVDRDGHVTSRLVVDRPETLDLLRRDAGGLERALQDAGLKTTGNGLQFSLRDQTMQQQQAFHQSRDTADVIVRDDALAPVETIQRGYRTLAGLRGGVDISV
jgi:chemotaxis protein MotD